MKPAKRIFGALTLLGIIAFLAIQFFQIDPPPAGFDHSKDYVVVSEAPKEIRSMIKDACTDCHSDETKYPWYASVQPIGWYLEDHVKHGKHHLNLSIWGDMEPSERAHAVEEIIEVLEDREMPLSEYTWLHKKARLSEPQVDQLVQWFKSKNKAH